MHTLARALSLATVAKAIKKTEELATKEKDFEEWCLRSGILQESQVQGTACITSRVML